MSIETDRLLIRLIREEDWRDFRALAEDFQRSPYAHLDDSLLYDEADTRLFVLTLSLMKCTWVVELKDTGKLIGHVGLSHAHGQIFELGYRFHSDFHGQGYAAEACRALLDYAAREWGASRFIAGTATENTPSVRLLTRLGFTLTKTEPQSFHTDEHGERIWFKSGVYELNIPV